MSSITDGHVFVDLLRVLREQDDILANEAANEIKRLRERQDFYRIEIDRLLTALDTCRELRKYEETAIRDRRNTIIEECSRECDEWAETERKVNGPKERIVAYKNAAAAIRALKDKP